MQVITILGVLTAFGLLFLSLLALCAARGFRPFAGVRRFYGRLSALGRIFFLALVGAFIVYASTKSDDSTNAPPARMSAQRRSLAVQPGVVISDAETNLGYRVLAVRDGDEIVPPGIEAVTNEAWRLRGGMMDAFRIGMVPEPTEEVQTESVWSFPWRAAWTQELTVFANGEFQPSVRDDFFPRPFGTNLSLAPQAKWGEIADGSLESLFWHELTPSNSLVLTWQNALYGRDANAPTNFQAELFGDGSFDYRYPDRTVSYAPVFPFDWDGDGLENSVDPEPRVAGPDAHGTNAEWYNNVCSNVFVAVEGTDGLTLAPRHAGVNTNAYYFVDVVAERGPAPIYFTADGPSRLGNPVVVAQAGVTNRVPLLIGATYEVTSSTAFRFVSVPEKALFLRGFSVPETRRQIVWPAGCNYEQVDGAFVPEAEMQERLHGTFSWEGGCCLRLQGDELNFECHGCACSGCSAVLSLSFEGYVIRTPGPSCGCSGHSGENAETPFVLTDAGGGVALGVSHDCLVISGTNGVGASASRSTRSVLTLAAWGGARGGTFSFEALNRDRLRPVGGGTFPETGERVLAPDETYSCVVTNEGVSASSRIGDIRASASFTEFGTGVEVRRNVEMTVCEIVLEGLKFNHDSASYTNDAINIRLDGGSNGGYNLTDGEWSGGGRTNCAACYVGGTRPVVNAKFSVRPRDISKAVIGAMPAGEHFSLGEIPPREVSFVAGRTGWVELPACGGTNMLPVRVGKETGYWVWNVTNVMDKTVMDFCMATTGPHRVYTVLAHPTLPWKSDDGNVQNPWVYALEIACSYAEGSTTTNGMLSEITAKLFHDRGSTYDTREGRARYVRDGGFYLTSFLRNDFARVNCYDQAYGVVVLGNLLGADAKPVFTELFGYINATDLIGIGNCNNPFYEWGTNTSRLVVRDGAVASELYVPSDRPVCNPDDVDRSMFSNHMYVLSNGVIFDACAGPVLGSQSLSQYLDSVIDYSTTIELLNSFYSPYVESETVVWPCDIPFIGADEEQ